MTAGAPGEGEDILRGKRILVVEDEYLIASELAGALRRHGGIVVGPVARLQDAEKLLAEDGIDVALLDINLRGAWSYPILDDLKARGIPVIIITGYEREVLHERFQRFTLVPKPFSAEALMSVVHRIMSESSDMK